MTLILKKCHPFLGVHPAIPAHTVSGQQQTQPEYLVHTATLQAWHKYGTVQRAATATMYLVHALSPIAHQDPVLQMAGKRSRATYQGATRCAVEPQL